MWEGKSRGKAKSKPGEIWVRWCVGQTAQVPPPFFFRLVFVSAVERKTGPGSVWSLLVPFIASFYKERLTSKDQISYFYKPHVSHLIQ